MTKRWTFQEDLFLAEYEGMDANFIAEHDLGRTSKGAGARRVKALKDAGVWDRIQAYIKARDVARCHHTLAFSTSPEARTIAAETLRDLGENLTKEAQMIVAIADEQSTAAERYLADFDAQRQPLQSKASGSDIMSMRAVPGYPFFPCRICTSEGFSGLSDGSCDHTAFERARAAGINIHPAQRSIEGRDRHNPKGPSRYAQAKTKQVDE